MAGIGPFQSLTGFSRLSYMHTIQDELAKSLQRFPKALQASI